MSVISEITRIFNNLKNTYIELEAMGADVPSTNSSDDLVETIRSLPTSTIAYDETTKILTITPDTTTT